MRADKRQKQGNVRADYEAREMNWRWSYPKGEARVEEEGSRLGQAQEQEKGRGRSLGRAGCKVMVGRRSDEMRRNGRGKASVYGIGRA